uniref:Uncharacterized protein n=1 Tax=Rhizophora mucronata TaxID=61149 RepID=A0A2P2IPL3_RHIMU
MLPLFDYDVGLLSCLHGCRLHLC